MAKYRVTSPDGQAFEVSAPDEASQDEVLNYAQQNWAKPTSQPAVAPPNYNNPQPTLDESGQVTGMSGLNPEPGVVTPPEVEARQSQLGEFAKRNLAVGAATAIPYIKQFMYSSQLAGIHSQAGDLEWRKSQHPGVDFSAEQRSLDAARTTVEANYAENKRPIDIANEFVAEARPEDATIVDDAIGSFAQTLPTMLAGLGGGTVAGVKAGLAIGAGGGGAVQAGQTAGEAFDKGADAATAMGSGLINGVLEGLGEFLGLGKVFEASKGGVLKIAHAIGYEATQEGVTQFLQDIVSKISYDPELGWAEMGRNAAVATLAGAMGGGAGVAHQGVVHGAHQAVGDLISAMTTNPVETAVRNAAESQLATLTDLKSKKQEIEEKLLEYGKNFDPASARDVDTAEKLDHARDMWTRGAPIEVMRESPDVTVREIATLHWDSVADRNHALHVYIADLSAQMYNGLPASIDAHTNLPNILDARPDNWVINTEGKTDTGDTMDAKQFDADPHARVLVIPTDPKSQASLAEYGDTLKTWAQKFAPDFKFILTDKRPNTPNWGNTQASASWGVNSKNSVVIAMNPRTFGTAEAPLSLAHELGHKIIDRMYGDSPQGIKDALLRAWKEELTQAVKAHMTPHQYMMMTSFPMQNRFFEPEKATLKKIFEYSQTGDNLGDYLRYFVNFAEWHAHQFERALAGDFKGMQSDVKSYVAEGIKKLKQVYNHFNKSSIVTYNVDELPLNQTFREFLEYHFTERAIQEGTRRLDAIEGAIKDEVWNLPEGDAALQTLNIEQLSDIWIPGAESRSPLGEGSNPLNRRLASIVRNYFGREKDTSDFQGDLDKFSKFKQITASLLYIAQQNRHIRQLYDPLGTADPNTGRVSYGYVNLVEKWHNEKMKRMANANDSLKLWRKLPKEDQAALNQYMIDQVLEGKFYNPLDPNIVEAYKLNDNVVAMFNRLKNDFLEIVDSLEATVLQEAQDRLIANPTAPQQLNEIKERFAELRTKPYFPLTRFGKYVALVRASRDITIDGRNFKQGEVIYREHFDSQLERAAAMDAIKGRWRGHEVKQDIVSEAVQSYGAVPREILEAMKSRLDLNEAQREELNKYLLELAPAQSYSKHLMQRRGIQGFTWDLQRSYANYMMQGSNYLARIKYSQPMRESIGQLQATANSITGDSSVRRQIANYMARHYDYIMSPENDWAALRAVVAVSYLGFMVKSAVVNLLQVPMVAFPHLAAIHGDPKAIAALAKAYTDVPRMYQQLRPLNNSEQAIAEKYILATDPLTPDEAAFMEKWTGLKADEFDAMNKWLEERAALQQAKSEGFIDEALAMELAGLAHGGMMSKLTAATGTARFMRSISHTAMLPFEMMERLNRRVTFIAAYRLAAESGLDANRAFVQAKEAVRQTQFEYAKYNRPELMRGKKGVLFMFMQYQLSMLYFLGGGDKGWWRAMSMLLLAGGVLGLPFIRNVMDVIEAVMAKVHPNVKTDLEKELRDLIGHVVDSPDVFLHGVSRYGFGALWWADLSGSISMGRVIPGTDVVKHLAEGQDWNAAVRDSVSEAGGATSTLIMRMLQAASSNDPDTWKRVERGMPLSVGQMVMTSLRWANRGGETDSKGAMIKSLDPNDPYEAAEIAGKALGFTPRSVAEAKEQQRLRQDFVNYYLIRRQLLLKSLNFSIEQGDIAGRDEALYAIRGFNQDIPFKSMSIKGDEIRNSVKQHAKAKAMQEALGVSSKRGAEIARELEAGN